MSGAAAGLGATGEDTAEEDMEGPATGRGVLGDGKTKG